MLPKIGQPSIMTTAFAFFGDFVSPHSLSSLQVFKWFRARTGGSRHLVGLMEFRFVVSGCIVLAPLLSVWFAEEQRSEKRRVENG